MEIISDGQFRCNYLRNKKHFSEFASAFLKSILKFQDVQKNNDPPSCISEITDSEIRGETNV